MCAAALAAALFVALPSSAVAAPLAYQGMLDIPDAPGAVHEPSAVVADSLGGIYVADTANHRIKVFAPSGEVVATLGSYGSGPGQLAYPLAVALGFDGRVYVADTGNDRVVVFETDGTYYTEFGTPGAGAGQFNAPSGIAVAANGVVYVSDTFNYRVQVFDAERAPLFEFGNRGPQPGQFDGARGLTLDADGFLYVADTNNQRIQKFDAASGAYTGEWGPFELSGSTYSRYALPYGVTFAPDGHLYVADAGTRFIPPGTSLTDGPRVEECDTGGNALASFGSTTTGSSLGYLNSARGAVRGADGALYVADTANNRIARWGAGGVPIASWEASGTLPGELSGPEGVATAADGTLWVSDTRNDRVQHLSPEGDFLGAIGGTGTGEGQMEAPTGVLVGPDGDVYVADTGNARIQRYSSTGSYETSTGGGILRAPRGMVIDQLGRLMVADATLNKVVIFGPGLGFVGSYGTTGSAPGQFNKPSDLAIDTYDKLFVLDTGNNRVQKFDADDGDFRLSFGTAGTASGQFSAPLGMEINAESELVVADTGNDRLQRFSGDGTWLAVDGGTGGELGRFHAPASVAVGADERIWVAERDGSRLQALTHDLVAPVTTIGALPALPVSADVTLTLEATDYPAGVRAIHYRLNGGPRRTFTGAVAVTGTAPVTIAYYAIDRAGNQEATHTAVALIDRIAPSTTASGIPVVAKGPFTVSLSATDAVAGVANTYYRVLGGDVTEYTGPFEVSGVGQTSVTWWSVDAAGNVEDEQTVTVPFDFEAPVGSTTFSAGAEWIATTTVSVESAVSGADEYRVGYDGSFGPWGPYAETTSVVLPAIDASYTLVAEYRDIAGNVTTNSAVIGRDTTAAPVPNLASPTHPVGLIVRRGTAPVFQWEGPTDFSGVIAYSYALDRVATTTPDAIADTVFTEYGAVGLDGGTWYFHVRAMDRAGNWGPASHVQVRLTSRPYLQAPTLTLVGQSSGGATYKVVGAVAPDHSRGGTVQFSAYRYESGRWVLRVRRAGAIVPDGLGGWRYRGQVTLPSGRWRVAVYHPYDSIYEPAWSPYSTPFTVR